MSERFTDYKKEKKLVLNKVTEEVSRQISDMLIKLDTVRSPLLLS
jgi:hypothetical protein